MLQSFNPIAQQSQRWIIQALLDLMELTEYDKISVSEICHRADLDRRTFYRNFNSKSDVLEQYINILGEEYIKGYVTIDNLCKYTATKYFFEFLNQYLCFIRNIKKSGLSDMVFQKFQKFTKEHMELLIRDDTQKLPLEYAFAYSIGGYWNVMMTWVANETILLPDEIALIITRI